MNFLAFLIILGISVAVSFLADLAGIKRSWFWGLISLLILSAFYKYLEQTNFVVNFSGIGFSEWLILIGLIFLIVILLRLRLKKIKGSKNDC